MMAWKKVSGFGFQVVGYESRVSGYELRVSSFGLLVLAAAKSNGRRRVFTTQTSVLSYVAYELKRGRL